METLPYSEASELSIATGAKALRRRSRYGMRSFSSALPSDAPDFLLKERMQTCDWAEVVCGPPMPVSLRKLRSARAFRNYCLTLCNLTADLLVRVWGEVAPSESQTAGRVSFSVNDHNYTAKRILRPALPVKI